MNYCAVESTTFVIEKLDLLKARMNALWKRVEREDYGGVLESDNMLFRKFK